MKSVHALCNIQLLVNYHYYSKVKKNAIKAQIVIDEIKKRDIEWMLGVIEVQHNPLDNTYTMSFHKIYWEAISETNMNIEEFNLVCSMLNQGSFNNIGET